MRKTEFENIANREDTAGIQRSISHLHKIIDEQIERGVSSERIIVGGFSQGGAIALLGGMSYPKKLGGIIALSTWLAMLEKIPSLVTDANKATPVFQAHGQRDGLVRFEWAVRSKELLEKKYGMNVEFHAFPYLEHSADPAEIDLMQKWMEARIPPLGRFSL